MEKIGSISSSTQAGWVAADIVVRTIDKTLDPIMSTTIIDIQINGVVDGSAQESPREELREI